MNRNAHLYRTLVSAAAVNGRIGGREALLLQEFRKRLGLTSEEAKRICQRVTSGAATYFVPRDAAARSALFNDVVKVVKADGRITARERSFLNKMRARFTRDIRACPRCATPLRRSGSRFGCEECGGAWVPGGSMLALHPNQRVRAWLREHRATVSKRKGWGGLRCRACRKALEVVSFGPPREQAYVERCPACGGVFVEVDQRARVKGIVRRAAGLRSRRHIDSQSWALVYAVARRPGRTTSRPGA